MFQNRKMLCAIDGLDTALPRPLAEGEGKGRGGEGKDGGKGK